MSKTVFVSYSQMDDFTVDQLEQDLTKRGIVTWIDTRDIPRGTSKSEAWQNAIAECEFFLACLSPDYFADEICQTQIFLARVYGKQLLPVLIGDFTDPLSRATLNPFEEIVRAGQANSYPFKGLEELFIANFSTVHTGWGMGPDYTRNFDKLVEAITPIPDPTPLNSKLLYISHPMIDKDFAYSLALDLKHARQRVWMDWLNLHVGRRWRDAMYAGLRAADHMLVCLSAEAVYGRGVLHEVQAAQLRDLPIYPVIPERVYQDPNGLQALEVAIQQSPIMKPLSDLAYFIPDQGYPQLLQGLRETLGLTAAAGPRQSIFLSYRRQDSAPIAGRIREKLVDRFGADTVFQDVASIQPGQDFVAAIKEWLDKSSVVLIIIGKEWTTIEQNGQPRIQTDGDFVRMEVAAALDQYKAGELTVIPVLVDGASMPKSADLPADLQGLLTINAAQVRNDPDFNDDIHDLIAVIAQSA